MSGFKIRAQMNDIDEAPGKVWFWELEQAVVEADRCVQCGACVAACPSDSIGVGDDGLPKLVKMCTGCSLCWDFCPRGGMRHEATWGLLQPADDPVGWKVTGTPGGNGLGPVHQTWTARARSDNLWQLRERPLRPSCSPSGTCSAPRRSICSSGP